MAQCIRCREDLSRPDARFCGNCRFPILNDASEQEVRERAREERGGFLDGFDVQTIQDSKSGDESGPAEAYQWYLEEQVKWVFTEIAFLQDWDWFDKGRISTLFFDEDLFSDNPSEDAMADFFTWVQVAAFLYEAFQPAALEVSIQLGAFLVEDVESVDEIDVSISVGSNDSDDSNITGPAS